MRGPNSSGTAGKMALGRWVVMAGVLGLGLALSRPSVGEEPQRWRQHDRQRPLPDVVSPSKSPASVPPPSDAVVLFDGTDLHQWQGPDGTTTRWKVEDGCMLPTPESGPIATRDAFGDIQMHLEWMSPTPPKGDGQGRGNSGVYLMGKYEVQVLDSYQNTTYADGQAAALYGQYPPLVNASLPPGEWQNYDIVFRRPRFNPDGSLATPTKITVFHNGILVQDGSELWGGTNWLLFNTYEAHPDSLPLALQDHGNPVRFRNVWLRKLADPRHLGPALLEAQDAFPMTPEQLDKFVGTYHTDDGSDSLVRRDADRLVVEFFYHLFVLKPTAASTFDVLSSDISVRFSDPPEEVDIDLIGSPEHGHR